MEEKPTNRFEGPNVSEHGVADEAFKRFASRLIALARSRLAPRIQQKLDAEDVVQSVYRSFVRRHAQGDFDLVNWDSLWGFLARFTVWKCQDKVKKLHAQQRDVRREIASPQTPDEWAVERQVNRDPTPIEAVVLAETIEHLMQRLDESGRQILSLALQGYNSFEIGQQIGRGERTVQRILSRVRSWLEEANREDIHVRSV